MCGNQILIFTSIATLCAVAMAGDTEDRRVIEAAQGEAKPVSDDVMKRVYEESKTPFKYGIVLKAEAGKKVDSPSVFQHGGKWYMMYIIFDGSGYETALAVSDDLLAWKPLGKVLPFREGTWDAVQSAGYIALQDHTWGGSCELATHDSKYWMSYLGGKLKGYESDPLMIGMAWTSDPTRPEPWTRLEAPVLTRDQPDCRDWEKLTQYKSNIIHDKSASLGYPFVMRYNAVGKEGRAIALATSKDLRSGRDGR